VNALEHLWEVTLHILNCLRVSNNFKQVFIAYEIESGKALSLFFKVLAKSLLDILERVGEGNESLFKVGRLHDFQYDGVLVHSLHQTSKLTVDVFEFRELIRQHGFYIG
jgi:hypothetical protein